MLQRLFEGIGASTGTAVRLTTLAAATAFALFVTTSFLCAAIFIAVLRHYGPVQACLAGAGVFLLLALVAGGSYLAYKKELERRAEAAAKAAAQSPAIDPMLVATGLQIARAIGIKRLVPILAIGGLALGILASRMPPPDDVPDDPE